MAEWIQGFKEINLGYTEEQAAAEAARCVNCGVCSERLQCVAVCQAKALDHELGPEKLELEVGAVILAPGFQAFDPKKYGAYHYAHYPNVVTSMEFERIVFCRRAFLGPSVRLSDGKEPKKIAWLQCVGSRDLNRCDNEYCSSVCCMYAIKESVIAKEHLGPDFEPAIFFMDMRTHGKDFEKYYWRAQDEHGVRFLRSRIHTIDAVPGTDDVSIRYLWKRAS